MDSEGSYEVFRDMAKRLVDENHKKFTYYEEAENALLFQVEHVIAVEEWDILRGMSMQAPEIIDRVYAIDGNDKVVNRFR